MARGYPQPFGPFVLLERIGEGSTGLVDLARPRDPKLGFPPLVVVKRLHVHLAEKKSFVRRFRHEGLLAISVDDPRVARVFDVGRVNDLFYLAIEYVPGWKLQHLLNGLARKETWPSLTSVVSLAVSGLLGAHAIHEAKHPRSGAALQAVHRDLSPNNLIVDPDGVLRVIDVGLGKSEAQDWRTKTGAIVGSLGYISPEQIKAISVDRRSDLYSLAVVLHELLTLRPYIPRGERAAMLTASAAPRFVPPSKVRPNVPPELDECLKKALSVNPDDRHPDCKTLAEELVRLIPAAENPAIDLGRMVGEDSDVIARSNYAPPTHVDVEEPEGDFEATEIYARRAAPPPVPPNSMLPESKGEVEVPTRVDSPQQGATQVATRVTSVSQPELHFATKVDIETATRVDDGLATRVADASGDFRVIPVTSTQPPFAHIPSKAGGKKLWPLLGLVVLVPLTAVVSVMVDRAMRTPTASAPPPAPLPAPVGASPGATPQAQPLDPPVAVERAVEPVRKAAPRKSPPRRVKSAPPPPTTVAAPPPRRPKVRNDAPFDAQQEIRKLTRRARSLADKKPALAKRANQLIADVSMWAASKDKEQTKEALKAASKRLRAMERGE